MDRPTALDEANAIIVMTDMKKTPKSQDPEYIKQKRKAYYEENKDYINMRKKLIRQDPDLKYKHLPCEIEREAKRTVRVMNNACDMYLLLSEEQKIKVILEIMETYSDFTECIIRKQFMERYKQLEAILDDFTDSPNH